MGFSVTASHLIFGIALLTAGAYSASSYWRVASDVDEARRAETDLAAEVAHTSISIPATPDYDDPNDRITFTVRNDGSTVLVMSEFAYLVNGAWNNNLATGYPTVSGATGTDLLMPRESMTVRLTGVTTAPTNVHVVAGNGASASWKS